MIFRCLQIGYLYLSPFQAGDQCHAKLRGDANKAGQNYLPYLSVSGQGRHEHQHILSIQNIEDYFVLERSEFRIAKIFIQGLKVNPGICDIQIFPDRIA